MLMRVIRGQTQPGQVEEFAKRWEAFYRSQLKEVPGFRHVHLAGDRHANTVVVVSLWDHRPDDALVGRVMQLFDEQVQDIIGTGPITIEDYELLVEF